MKKISMFLISVVIFLSPVAATARDWQEMNSDHFIVYFTQDKKFAKKVLAKAERYYRSIATELGYPRYSEFWTWDNRVEIYIHPDHNSFLKATGQPSWSQGMADYTNKQIVSYVWSENFLDSLLPHEMAHLIFRDFVGFKGEIPLWLDEGVAQWAEEIKRKEMKDMAKNVFEKNKLLLLEDLMEYDLRDKLFEYEDRVLIRPTITKDGYEGVLILSVENFIHTYYLQAVSLVGFLIEKYGSDRFAHFCRQLRDGKSVEEALSFAYSTNLNSLEKLEQKWREYLKKYNP